MKFHSLMNAALALASIFVSATTVPTLAQSPLDLLASSVKARDAAINTTVAGYRARTVPLSLAATYIKGNLSATHGLMEDFKTTVSNLMSHFQLGNSTLSPSGSVPAGLYNSRDLPQRASDFFTVYGDLGQTLAPIQADPILGPAVLVLEYAVLIAQAYLGIAEFLLVFAYDELFVPGGYPWGVALPY